MMDVVIRTDASLTIGTGHVMRCLTLAEALKQQGVDITFICRAHKGHLLARIEQHGFKTYKLPESIENTNDAEQSNSTERERLYGTQWLGSTQQQDAEQCQPILEKIRPDWLIIDHYAIDTIWQELLKGSYKQLMVIDDLADRTHQCDLLLDQTYGRSEEDYIDYVPKNCQMLLGSQYALLRPEFAQWREYSLKRRVKPELKQLLITMGGVDPDNVTGQVLKALKSCKLPQELEVTIIMGGTAPNIDVVQKQAEKIPYKAQIKTAVNNMAELMANADLVIGAAGSTSWEGCCLGVPLILYPWADNQKEVAYNLKNKGAIIIFSSTEGLIKEILTINHHMSCLSSNAMLVCDGMGIKKLIRFFI